jgi:hypothetical protein
MSKFRFSVVVYDDHAQLLGSLSSEVLLMLLELCREQGFTHMVPNEEAAGFKLVRKKDAE